MTERTLYEEGWQRYPWWWILGENVLMWIPWVIGFVTMWPLQVVGVPVVSLGYALFILVTIGWLLKKHNCSTCVYYGKWCHLGWGKYAALMCKRDAGNPETGTKLAVVYVILPLIPIVGAVAVMLMGGFSWALLIAMVVFVAFNGVQFAVRPKACARCKRRTTCPGSAAKEV